MNILKIQLDPILAILLLLVSFMGLIILYSAVNQDLLMLRNQMLRFALGTVILIFISQIQPEQLKRAAPWLYLAIVFLLVIVLISGHVGNGAKRWLNLGLFHFQPAEIMKIVLPLMLAWYFSYCIFPPRNIDILFSLFIILVPMLLTAKQPDLGTAILIGMSGFAVLILAGMSWRLLSFFMFLAAAFMPIGWHFMHDYQKQRLLTFLNPESDPLGSGYHIIQSKIAIGSGGLFGKGWLNGTQSHLQFLPEHSTDFIFSVSGEEFGFIGVFILILLYTLIIGHCFYIAEHAKNKFSRLVIGSITIMFFFSIFINIGMVSGLLPVVGVPLPLVSYGGTSVVTILASFGIIMSIAKDRKLMSA